MIEILTGDFRELSKAIPDDSIDLILTDPPYAKEFLPLWADLGRVSARVLRPNGFLVTYSGQLWLDEIIILLRQHLTWYWQILLLQPGNSRVWARNMVQEWKPILVYCKPPCKRTNAFGSDFLISPSPSKEWHKWGQSLPPVKELVERFSKSGDLVYDPFLGGGTTAIACYQLGRNCIGHEIDPQVAEDARKRLAETQPPLFTMQGEQLGLM